MNAPASLAWRCNVRDFKQFANTRPFGAWLSLVPGQNSTGGKVSLGRITKRGDGYLHTILSLDCERNQKTVPS